MSYRNNWNISGVTGMTSLKDCYKSNGVSILDNVGCPRLDDTNAYQDSQIHIGQQPKETHTDYKHYAIPKYLINGKSFGAYGFTGNTVEEVNDKNFVYDGAITYKSSEHAYSNAKWWNYYGIPIIVFDDLVNYTNKSDDYSLNALNNLVVGNKVYWKDNLVSVYRVVENTPTINSSRVNIYNRSFFSGERSGGGNHKPKFPFLNSATRTLGVMGGYSQASAYYSFADLVRFEYIFHTNTPDLVWTKIYGREVNADILTQNLIAGKGYGFYSIGVGGAGQSVLSAESSKSTVDYNIYPSTYDERSNVFYSNMTAIKTGGSMTTADYAYNYEGWFNLKLRKADAAYSIFANDNGYHNGSITALSAIYVMAPVYTWLYDVVNPNYTTTSSVNNPYLFIGDSTLTSPASTTLISKFLVTTANTRNSDSKHAGMSTYYWNWKTGDVNHYSAEGAVTFPNYGTHETTNLPVISCPYVSPVGLPFPYDNTNNTDVLNLTTDSFITGNLGTSLQTNLGNRCLHWFATNYFPAQPTPEKHGTIIDRANGKYLYFCGRTNAGSGQSIEYAIDFSFSLPTSSNAFSRRAAIAFCKEPVYLEYSTSEKTYTLRYEFTDPTMSEAPKHCKIPMYIVDTLRTIDVNFGDNYTITTDANGNSLSPYSIRVARNVLIFMSNGTAIGFETGYSSLKEVITPRVYVDRISYGGDDHEEPRDDYDFVNNTPQTCTYSGTYIYLDENSLIRESALSSTVGSFNIENLFDITANEYLYYYQIQYSGYLSGTLTYGTVPQAIVYIDGRFGAEGTLTGATVTFNGNTYTSTTIENNKVKFVFDFINVSNKTLQVTNVTTSNGCVLYEPSSINVTQGSQTCYVSTIQFSWDSVNGIYEVDEGPDERDNRNYVMHFAPGFLTSYTGYAIFDGHRYNFSDTLDTTQNEETVYQLSVGDGSATYIEVVATNYQGETRTLTYGTKPVATVNVSTLSGTLTKVYASFNGQAYEAPAVNGVATFSLNYWDISNRTFLVTAIDTSDGYVLSEPNSTQIISATTYNVNVSTVKFSWDGVNGVSEVDDGPGDTDHRYYMIYFAPGFLTAYSGYVVYNGRRSNISGSLTASQNEESVYSLLVEDGSADYVEVNVTNYLNEVRTLTYGTKPEATVYITPYNGYGGTLTSATVTFNGNTYTSTSVTNNIVAFTFDYWDINDSTVRVTAITTSDGYTLKEVAVGRAYNHSTSTILIYTTIWGWGGVHFNRTYVDGGDQGESYYDYNFDCPPSYVASYSGFVIHAYSRTNIANNVSSDVNEFNIWTELSSGDTVNYIEVTLTNYLGETRTYTYGTRPVATIYVGVSGGTLTSVTATFNGSTYTSTTISSNRAVFSFDYWDISNDRFQVTDLATSDGYVMDDVVGDRITTPNTYTLTVQTTVFSWAGVAGINRRANDDHEYYEYYFTCPRGFISSYSGFIINDYSRENRSGSGYLAYTDITVAYTDYSQSFNYMEITLTNYNGETRTYTYGTRPVANVAVQIQNSYGGTLTAATVTFNGHTYSGSANNGVVNFSFDYWDISNRQFNVDSITTSDSYIKDGDAYAIINNPGSYTVNVQTVAYGWAGVSQILREFIDGGGHEADYYKYYQTCPTGFITGYSGYKISGDSWTRENFSGSVSGNEIYLTSVDVDTSLHYIEVTLTNINGATRTYTYGTKPHYTVYIENRTSGTSMTSATATFNNHTYTSTTIENSKIRFDFDLENIVNDWFSVSSINFTNGYILDSVESSRARNGTDTIRAHAIEYGWGNVYIGRYDTDYDSYTDTTVELYYPTGFITSGSGYYTQGGVNHSFTLYCGPNDNSAHITTYDDSDDSVTYVSCTCTASNGTTRTITKTF